MPYIDGFVAAVPTANKQKFIDHARTFDGMFLECGATRVVEAWGDDVPDGKVTSFPMAVKLEDGEAVVFSWLVWPDKKTADDAWAKMQEDPAMANMDMPFDGKRMMWGGFETIFDEKQ